METCNGSQSVTFREGGVTELGAILDGLRVERLLFVVDPAAYSETAGAEQLKHSLERRRTVYFGEFELNPKIEDVQRGIQLYNELAPDAVVAFGGGTAIDLAKMIRGLASHGGEIDEVLGGKLSQTLGRTPLVAIPTTAGTGSEATHFAVVYRNGQKFSVAYPELQPNFAIIDPVLTYSMPKSLTAVTGLDALCQAVESIWAVAATDESVDYAVRSLALSFKNLEQAVKSPTPNVRRAMCEAAHLAGKAINISKTTAPHALSYWLTSHYGIPHGAAVGLFLGRMLDFNSQVSHADCNDPRGPRNVQARIERLLSAIHEKDAVAGRRNLERLITAIGCPVSLAEIGIVDESALIELAENANIERLTNNPRRLGAEQLFELLDETNLIRRT